MTAAGLDGIKKKLDPGDPVDENIYHLTPEKRHELGIQELPGSLKEAAESLRSDHDFLKSIVPQSTIDHIIENGTNEHNQIALRTHPYEFQPYFDI